jgi:hypothetical protein
MLVVGPAHSHEVWIKGRLAGSLVPARSVPLTHRREWPALTDLGLLPRRLRMVVDDLTNDHFAQLGSSQRAGR